MLLHTLYVRPQPGHRPAACTALSRHIYASTTHSKPHSPVPTGYKEGNLSWLAALEAEPATDVMALLPYAKNESELTGPAAQVGWQLLYSFFCACCSRCRVALPYAKNEAELTGPAAQVGVAFGGTGQLEWHTPGKGWDKGWCRIMQTGKAEVMSDHNCLLPTAPPLLPMRRYGCAAPRWWPSAALLPSTRSKSPRTSWMPAARVSDDVMRCLPKGQFGCEVTT